MPQACLQAKPELFMQTSATTAPATPSQAVLGLI